MIDERSVDERISAWLFEEAPNELPDRTLAAVFDRTRVSRQRRPLAAWRPPARPRLVWLLVALALIVALAAGLLVIGSRPFHLTETGPGRSGLVVFDANWQIVVQNPDGTGRRELTAGSNDFWPTWSPDGTKVAFYRASTTTDFLHGASIWIANADGSGARNVTDPVAVDLLDEWRPTWAPTGDRIAFASGSEVDSSLYGAGLDGAPPRLLVGTDFAPSSPVWAPDGKSIAMRAGRYDDERGVYLVNPDGSGLHRLTTRTHQRKGDSVPAWSPDGSTLVFHAGDPGVHHIWVVNHDGSGERQLTDAPFPVEELWPAWSPDGRWIAFSRLDHQEFTTTVMVMRSDGTGARSISSGAASGQPVSWSADGTQILISICAQSDCDGGDALWEIVALDPSGVGKPHHIGFERGLGLLSWQRLPP
jgi:TolB protein